MSNELEQCDNETNSVDLFEQFANRVSSTNIPEFNYTIPHDFLTLKEAKNAQYN